MDPQQAPAPKSYTLILRLVDHGDTFASRHRYATAAELQDVIESLEPSRGMRIVEYRLLDSQAHTIAERVND